MDNDDLKELLFSEFHKNGFPVVSDGVQERLQKIGVLGHTTHFNVDGVVHLCYWYEKGDQITILTQTSPPKASTSFTFDRGVSVQEAFDIFADRI